MILVLLICLGLISGSFVNALVWRLKKKRNWVSERSECTHCHHVLAGKDLVPVLSWLWLKGKCRYCGKKIEDTPITEIGTAAAFALSYLFWPVALQGVGLFQFVFWLIFLVAFAALTVYDFRWFILPNKIVYPVIGLAVIQVLLQPILFHYSWHEALNPVLGALLLWGMFYLLYQGSNGEWIGGGDVKLVIALGLIAGTPLRSVLILFFASFLGIFASLPQIVSRKSGALKLKIPFGPFLILGMVVVQLFGTSIISWYMNLFMA